MSSTSAAGAPAAGVPRGAPSGTARPTGFARYRRGDYAGRDAAAAFAGLPAGYAHPEHLLQPMRLAGARLPFSKGAFELLQILVGLSRAADWSRDGEPLVWPSNGWLVARTGTSLATVHRHLRELREAAAIVAVYGPGNRRAPVRGSDGDVAAAYGISLKPLPALAVRIKAVVDAQVERAGEVARVEAVVRLAARECGLHLDAALAAGADPAGDDAARLAEGRDRAAALAREAAALRRRDHRLDDDGQRASLERLSALAAEAEAVRRAGEAAVRTLLASSWDVESTPSRVAGGTHNATRDSHFQRESYCYPGGEAAVEGRPTGSAAAEGGPRGGADRPPVDKAGDKSVDKSGGRAAGGPRPVPGRDQLPLADFGFTPQPERPVRREPRWSGDMLASLSPVFETAMRTWRMKDPSAATLDDLAIVGRLTAARLGMHQGAWESACRRHGEVVAALAALAAAEKPAGDIRASRAAYLAGLWQKPPEEVNPLASLFGHAKARGISVVRQVRRPAPDAPDGSDPGRDP